MSESTNYGETGFTAVCVSHDGSAQTTVTKMGYVYTSSDFGKTWVARMTDEKRSWSSVSLSETGKYQTAVTSTGKVYISCDSGTTWDLKYENTELTFTSIIISRSGKYQTIISNVGYMVMSSDFGENWGTNSVVSVKQCQATVGVNGYLWITSDFGHTWYAKMTDKPRRWASVSVSECGQFVTAVEIYGRIYVSSDFGETWYAREAISPTPWTSVSICAFGKYQTAVSLNGCVYVSSDFGVTWEMIKPFVIPAFDSLPAFYAYEDWRYGGAKIPLDTPLDGLEEFEGTMVEHFFAIKVFIQRRFYEKTRKHFVCVLPVIMKKIVNRKIIELNVCERISQELFHKSFAECLDNSSQFEQICERLHSFWFGEEDDEKLKCVPPTNDVLKKLAEIEKRLDEADYRFNASVAETNARIQAMQEHIGLKHLIYPLTTV